MVMDAKEFFERQESTAREIPQQLEKEHTVRAKTALKSTHKFREGDPVWVLRPRPVGTQCNQTWFTPRELVCRIG